MLSLDESLADPQFKARGMIVEDADGEPAFAPPWRFVGESRRATGAAPAQGEHTRAILAEAGYADDAIEALVAAGIVTAP